MSIGIVGKQEPASVPMSDLNAVMIIEGDDYSNDELILDAYQALLNSGTLWHLQGSYQRAARVLLNEGLIQDPADRR